jgi:hypothetical protein
MAKDTDDDFVTMNNLASSAEGNMLISLKMTFIFVFQRLCVTICLMDPETGFF